MIYTSGIPARAYARPHCAGYGCQKCGARTRWNRSKGWRSRKNPSSPRHQKEVMR